MKNTLIILLLIINSYLLSESLIISSWVSPETILDFIVVNSIPKEFQETLIKETMEFPELRVWIVSIGYVESNWKYMESLQPNRNGSIDVGPLGLNINNLNNDYFIYKYGREDDYLIKDKNNYYMALSIRYFIHWYKIYGTDAIFIYNAGPGRYLNNNLPQSTIEYEKKVRNYYINFKIRSLK